LNVVRPADAYVLLAWAGLWCHELARVPSVFGFTSDGSLPMLGVALVLVMWRRRPAAVLRAFGWVLFAGAILTVLPLPILPFAPEQTVEHYAAHVIFALAQVPLLRLGANSPG
jgi:hypothetical protein